MGNRTGVRAGLLGIILGLSATKPALSDVLVQFFERAPKDQFMIVNMDGCDMGPVTITIDLEPSFGNLFFDTTPRGAGVAVYQPFELTMGQEIVTGITPVTDGSTAVALELAAFPAQAHVGFTADIDDPSTTGPAGPTMIAGPEISGARITVSAKDGLLLEGEMDLSASVTLPHSGCVL